MDAFLALVVLLVLENGLDDVRHWIEYTQQIA